MFSCQLQDENKISGDIPAAVDSAVSELEFLQTNIGNGLVQTKATIGFKDKKAFYKSDKQKFPITVKIPTYSLKM